MKKGKTELTVFPFCYTASIS